MDELIYRQVGRDVYYKVWHKLDMNMLMLVKLGSGSIVSREKSYPMRSGTLCFIGADKYHYTFPDHPDKYERSKIFISSDEMEKIVQMLYRYPDFNKIFNCQQITVAQLTSQDLERAEEIFYRLNQVDRDSVYFQAELYSAVIQLMVLIVKDMAIKTQNNFGVMQTAVEYINNHISENITVEQICRASYMSKFHFCRLFKEKIGLTVMEYVLRTRIIMAKELLTSGNLSISEISERCGFSSTSYFSRAFKLETGLTPMQFKKSNKSNK
ncbi:MAG: helix-turn-helix transcriptional regulator [Clostridia bacterium]|nr:helix-turn-helix transcriptional regulator [Clostridia bacterium]